MYREEIFTQSGNAKERQSFVISMETSRVFIH
jgi:hypothetical protein